MSDALHPIRILDRATATATAKPGRLATPSATPTTLNDYDIGSYRSARTTDESRLYPARHAAIRAVNQLRPLPARTRTGVVLVTSVADRPAVDNILHSARRRSPESPTRHLDLAVATSRFAHGALLADLVSHLDAGGPDLCLPQEGADPLALAQLLLTTHRADAVVIVQVDPVDHTRWRATAEIWTRDHDHDGIDDTAPPTHPAPRGFTIDWAQHRAGPWQTPTEWLQTGRDLITDATRRLRETDIGVVLATFLDLAPEYVNPIRTDRPSTTGSITKPEPTRFADTMRQHAAWLGWTGPVIALAGTPGSSLSALAVAQDLLTTQTQAVVVVAGDWVGAGITYALDLLHCPDKPRLKSGMSAALLLPANEQENRDNHAFHVLTGRAIPPPQSTHQRTSAIVSGCTSYDLTQARAALSRADLHELDAQQHRPRFLGADALACLITHPTASTISVHNELGGSGLILQ